jgi:hypothetical protein
VRGDEFLHQESSGLYMFLVVGFQQIRCMDVICWFPCVITLGVSSPLDEIL